MTTDSHKPAQLVSRSGHAATLTAFKAPALVLVPWAIVIIGWSYLMTWPVTLPLIAWTLSYRTLERKNYTISGLLKRHWVKMNNNSVNNCPD